MDEFEKQKLLKEAELYSKNSMGIEEDKKEKKNNRGCLISVSVISVLIILFYIFIIYYRHRLFVDMGL